jgi:pimeloyl-ACP methyl ester carboxylesterase
MSATTLLNHLEYGAGDRVAVLLHGMQGSAESWWRVAPRLAHSGYRVLALDLPGHGESSADSQLTIDRAADAVTDTVASLTDAAPALAIGHSLGGQLLAAAAQWMRPGRAVYVDSPFTARGGWDYDEMLAHYEEATRVRTYDYLRANRPHYSDADCEVEARAAEQFDPATWAAVSAGPGGRWMPAPGSLVIRADPSDYVSDELVAALRAEGVDVVSIRGAAHSVWYSHYEEFMAALAPALAA